MHMPSIPKQTKPFLFGAVVGAIALAVVGFNFGGWVTAGGANNLAEDRSDAATVAALTPVCVDRFRRSTDVSANLTALKAFDSDWVRREFVKDGGWADVAGSKSDRVTHQVATACAQQLNQVTL